MEVRDFARGVFLRKTPVTVFVAKAQITGSIDAEDEIASKTKIIQRFHADEPLIVLMAQVLESAASNMADKMIESFGNRQGLLIGASQVVEIVKNGAFQITQIVIG